MRDDDWSASVRGSGFSAALGALLARLRACADDPMWADHAEVSKALITDAANALEETGDIADHLMAQRDEERGRMARAVLALGVASQCIHAAANDQWQSFDALSDDFDDAIAEVMKDAGAEQITPASMRQAVAAADKMMAVDLCSNCLGTERSAMTPRTNTLRRRPWPHELADACGADGLSMAQVQQKWGLSTWPAYQAVVDAIELGAIVRVGTARTRACRYLRADLPAEVIEQREAEIRARIRVRKKERVPMEDGIPIRRIIVSAADAKPLTVRGPRSVWDLGAS